MNDRPPERVRVTGPSRHAPRPASPSSRHIDAQTRLGEIYLTSLLREQLRLAGLALLVLVATVVSLPVVFWLAPGLAEIRWWGIPLPWLLLGFAVYPLLVLVGWRYVRAAERNEDDFAKLLEEEHP